MARNMVQFQKGLSEAEFRKLYGDEAQCLALVIEWRWSKGRAGSTVSDGAVGGMSA